LIADHAMPYAPSSGEEEVAAALTFDIDANGVLRVSVREYVGT
jgi:hypothetical protein